MDELMLTTWVRVYEGNSHHHGSTIINYLCKYAKYMYSSPEMVIDDITGDDLFRTVADAGHTAQGMDHCSYTDLSLLPLSAFHYLALLLRLIESGKPWPAELLFSRVHILSKNPDEPLNPMEYRFLMITSWIYRLWGKTRLRHLQPWIDRWRLPNMYGGLQGVGADDAWYATSLDVEFAMLYNSPLFGAVADLYKFFDQIIRGLLYVLLSIAGLPSQLLVAYMGFMEHTLHHNSIGDAYGIGHKHRCGMPQRC